MRVCVAIGIAALFTPQAAWCQTTCPCDTTYWASIPHSTVEAAPITSYRFIGVPPEQLRKLEECIGPLTGSIKLDSTLRNQLCACSPEGLCFDMFLSDPVPEGYSGPSVLYIQYRRHPAKTR